MKEVNKSRSASNKKRLNVLTQTSDEYKKAPTVAYKRLSSVYIKDKHDNSKDPNNKTLTE